MHPLTFRRRSSHPLPGSLEAHRLHPHHRSHSRNVSLTLRNPFGASPFARRARSTPTTLASVRQARPRGQTSAAGSPVSWRHSHSLSHAPGGDRNASSLSLKTATRVLVPDAPPPRTPFRAHLFPRTDSADLEPWTESDLPYLAPWVESETEGYAEGEERGSNVESSGGGVGSPDEGSNVHAECIVRGEEGEFAEDAPGTTAG